MAASGNKTVQVTAYDTLKFSWWETSQDIANNRTVIGWKVELIAIDDGRIKSTGGDPWSVTVNGTKYSGTCDVSISNNTTKTLASGNTTIAHGNDGKKTFSYAFTVSFDGIYFAGSNIGVKSGSGSGTLTTIPRTSSFTIPSSAAAGTDIPVSITRAVSSFTHDVKLQFGNKTQTYSGIATSVNVVAPLAWLDQIPNAANGTLTVTVTTKSGSTVIGSTSKTMTITASDRAKPSVSMSLLAVGSLPEAFAGLYIAGKSKVKAVLTASGQYGAAISKREISVAGGTYGASHEYTSGYLTQYGTVAVVGKVVDSRGISNTVTENITVIAYNKPQIQSSICARCDQDGVLNDSGTYLRIRAKRIYSPVKSGNIQKNFCEIRYRYKANTDTGYSAWRTLMAGARLDGDEVDSGALLEGALLVDRSYTVQIQAIDDLGEEAITTVSIPTDAVFMHKRAGGKGLGVGKYAESDGLMDVAWSARVRKGFTVDQDTYLNGTVRLPSVWDINYEKIPANSDLNTYLNVGHYRCDHSGIASTVANIPFGGAFLLHVYCSLSSDRTPPTSNVYKYFIQELTAYTGLKYWRTITYNNSTTPTFGVWVKNFDTSSLLHYVMDQGTTGIWTYRKWNSGIAECWGKTAKTISTTTAWGNGGLYLDSGGRTYADYPSGLFIDIPVCQFSAEGKSSSVIPMTAGELGTKTRTPQLQFVRGTSSSNMAVTVHWHALGRWK